MGSLGSIPAPLFAVKGGQRKLPYWSLELYLLEKSIMCLEKQRGNNGNNVVPFLPRETSRWSSWLLALAWHSSLWSFGV